VDADPFNADLQAWSRGDQAAGDRLYASAFAELKQVASRSLRAYGRGDQLQTTVLVNECYLKLASGGAVSAESRRHFMALCARAMRQIIVDSARRQMAEKRDGGQMWQITLSESLPDVQMPTTLGPESIAALDQALTELDRREPRLARIAECRMFSDMSTAEIAQTFGVNERTVQREWLRVKALLVLVITPGP
jgi:RNA polymerase sigma factor (TIGR02999 family)